MKIVMFYHSLVSDWNNGNAHFLRGIASELIRRGHIIKVFERENGWSYSNLKKNNGAMWQGFKEAYPLLSANFYNDYSEFNEELSDTDLVIVHEWNTPELVKYVGDLKQLYDFQLLFHDTHHRSVTARNEMSKYDLSKYDGVLAFGQIISNIYLKNNWAKNAWTWHEAADTTIFFPHDDSTQKEGDVVWIGNWGENERAEELNEFLIHPVKNLGLKAKIYGVRYPDKALKLLEEAGIEYGGYIPSYKVPSALSRYKMTVHIPRRPYTQVLPGIPTIRPFEAMACGIPLLSSPWKDSENLFSEGLDYKIVKNGKEMEKWMEKILTNEEMAKSFSENGLKTIRKKHTCRHRVDELLTIYESLNYEKQRI